MNTQLLHHMYQAWIQDNNEYIGNWCEFAAWVARCSNNTAEEILEKLTTCWWADITRK